MSLDEILASLFPAGAAITSRAQGLFCGEGDTGIEGLPCMPVLGIADRTPLGVDGALTLAGDVLDIVKHRSPVPLLLLMDGAAQRMSRRDELLGLNEYLAHVAKALHLAESRGFVTIGLLYGHAAAGAFIATMLATRVLVALPDAHPAVMELASMSRVTKLPLETLQRMAQASTVFGPGLENMIAMGAVTEVWDPTRPLNAQLAALLGKLPVTTADLRDRLGFGCGGRRVAARIAERVRTEASH